MAWRSDGQTFIGAEDQRAAVKQVGVKDVSVDPQPELRRNPEESIEDKKKTTERKRLAEADSQNGLVKEHGTAVEELTEDRAPRATGTAQLGLGFRKVSHALNDATEPQGQVERSKQTVRNPKSQHL